MINLTSPHLQVVYIRGDVAEHAHVVSVVNDAGYVPNLRKKGVKQLFGFDQIMKNLMLMKWLLTTKDGNLHFRVRDVDCGWHPCPIDDVLRRFDLLYRFPRCLNALEVFYESISVVHHLEQRMIRIKISDCCT